MNHFVVLQLPSRSAKRFFASSLNGGIRGISTNLRDGAIS